MLWTESFRALNPSRWQEIVVRRHTHYGVVDLEGQWCLQARSHSGASLMVSPVRFDPRAYRSLSWQWRVDRLVAGERLTRKDGSDAAARVYVYFESEGLPWQKRNLDYVWSASLPIGTILSSAYASHSKIIVVESGPAFLGRWRTVTRDLREDYQQCFASVPPPVVAIGLMTDTDNTGSDAIAYFDELRVGRAGPDGTEAAGSRAGAEDPAGRGVFDPGAGTRGARQEL